MLLHCLFVILSCFADKSKPFVKGRGDPCLIFILCCRYTSNSDYLTTDDLLLFLEAEQGVMYNSHCNVNIHTVYLLTHNARVLLIYVHINYNRTAPTSGHLP